jgi:protein-tyrosine phosphatase
VHNGPLHHGPVHNGPVHNGPVHNGPVDELRIPGGHSARNGGHRDGRGWLHVCFVCTGNICRSPMADVVLRELAAEAGLPDGSALADHLRVTSGGTGGWHAGEPMDDRARAALHRRGYADHRHRARRFESAWFPWTDLVVCLDRSHRQTLAGLAKASIGDDSYEERLVLLRSFDPAAGADVDVPDPYYGGDADFDDCLDMVESGCRGLACHLQALVGPDAQGNGTKDSAS